LMGQTQVLHINVAQKLDRVNIYNNNDLVNPIKSVRFAYDYTLCPSTPNSSSVAGTDGANGGKLTLKSVQVFGQNDIAAMPAYLFEYANGNAPGSGRNPAFNVDDWDMWGSYKDPQDRGRFNHRTPEQDAIEGFAKQRADQAAA